MHPRVRTCLLLLVGVLTGPCMGGTIGNRDGRIHIESGGATDPSGEERTANRPLWKTSPESFHLRNARMNSPEVGGAQVSGIKLDEVPASTPDPLRHTSPVVVQQAGTSELPMELRPLLDEDQLVALELAKLKTTLPSSTSASVETNVPVAVTASDQDEGVKVIPSQLAEVFESILNESTNRGHTTTQRSGQPPRVNLASQKPPLGSTGNSVKFEEFLPQIEEMLKGAVIKHKPTEPQLPRTIDLPPPQTPKVPNTEEDLKHILPTLEEALGSILNSEAKIPATTSQPMLPPVRPTTDTVRPVQTPNVPPTDTEGDLKHIFPTLEEALSGILKESESKAPATTNQPVPPPVRSTTTDIRRPLQTPKVPRTDAEGDLKHILPTLEEALGSILKDSEVKVITTTRRPVVPPVHLTTTDSREHFAAVLPQLEDAIRSVLEEAVLEQEATAQKHTSPPSAWQPTPPTTKDYGFGNFLPELEQMFGDIMHNHKSNHSATFPNTPVPTSTVELTTEQRPSIQNNIVLPDSPSTHSKPLFLAVKATLQDVFDHQEVEAKKLQA